MYGSASLNRPPVNLWKDSTSPGIHRVSQDTRKIDSAIEMSSFIYNERVALVLIPSLLVLVGYGGPLVAGVLLVCFSDTEQWRLLCMIY